MKRFTHAWISYMAVQRLRSIADQLDEPLKGQVLSLHNLLKDKIVFIVEGSWIPDSIIADNHPGHIWKYTPLFLCQNDLTNVRQDHNTTDRINSFSKGIAEISYAWDRPWLKNPEDGTLVDRCQGFTTMLRDLFLLREDEFYELAATIYLYLKEEKGEDIPPEELGEYSEKVVSFLFDPVKVSSYYKGFIKIQVDQSSERKKEIRKLKLRSRPLMKKIVKHYRERIDYYIRKHIGSRYINNKDSMFPLYSQDNQLALHLFSLSHYIADAHMPLHCDKREFTQGPNIHKKIEETWEKWILNIPEKELVDVVSEFERGRKFVTTHTEDGEYKYPNNSPFEIIDNDPQLKKLIWHDRVIDYNPKRYITVWDDIVGVAYISYCLGSRMVRCDKDIVGISEHQVGSLTSLPGQYGGIDYGNVLSISKDNWMDGVKPFEQTELDELFSSVNGDYYKVIYKVNSQLSQKQEEIAFNFISICLLLDAIDKVAITWARLVKDHFEVAK